MVYVFTATDELCSVPFPFRFMTGLWLVAPCSLPTTLPCSLSLRQNGVHGIARLLT